MEAHRRRGAGWRQFFSRLIDPNRRPPVPVNRSGLTRYQKTNQIQIPNQKRQFKLFRPIRRAVSSGYRAVSSGYWGFEQNKSAQ